MNRKLIAGIATSALVVSAGTAAASGVAATSGTATKKAISSVGDGGRPSGPPPFAAAVATYLGLTDSQIQTQLQAGKSLSDIATAQGKSVSGLKDAIVAAMTSALDADVAAGKITSAQEQTRIADFTAHVSDLISNTGGPGHGGPGGLGHGDHGTPPFAAAVASYLGLTDAQIKTQLQSGKTLADIAVAQGKTSAGLQDVIVTAITSDLDSAVAAGKLTTAQETSMIAGLKAHVADIVTHTGPPAGERGPGGPGGPGGSSSTTNTFRR
jgi:hypothetical protein